MKTIKIEKFNGLDDFEKMEVARNALDIYKFFKLLNYGDFDLVDTKNQNDFQSVVDGLCNFLPFVKRNYDTIIEFDDDVGEYDEEYDADDFLTEIDRTVEETIRNNNLNTTITSDDVAKYSKSSEEIEERIEERIDDVDNDDLIEFLKKHGLIATFYSEYCN